MAAPLRALLDYSKILNELRFLIKADFKDLLCSLQKPDKQKVEKTTESYIDFFLEMRFHADLTQQEQQVQKKKDAKSCFDKQLIKIFVEQKKAMRRTVRNPNQTDIKIRQFEIKELLLLMKY